MNFLDSLKLIVKDSWLNTMSGLGTTRDKRMFTTREQDQVFDETYLDTLFEDDIFDRICSILPEEETRAWISIPSDPENRIMNDLDRLDARKHFTDARTWSRVYGGALMLKGIDDGQAWHKPLQREKIKSINWLKVVNRFRVQVEEWYSDPKDPKYRQPAVYRVMFLDGAAGGMAIAGRSNEVIIHETRCEVFDGLRATDARRQYNQMWGDSLIQKIYEPVRDYSAAYRSLFAFMQEFGVGVYSFKGLIGMLASDNEGAILKRMSLMDAAKSMVRGIPMDADNEKYERIDASIAGLSDLMLRLDARLSLASGMPITLLLGQPQGGLNSTGEGDQRNWYNKIAASQDVNVRKPLTNVVNDVAAAIGAKPQDGSVEHSVIFNSLWISTDKEREEARFFRTQSDEMAIKTGVLSAAEVRASRYGGDDFKYDTTIKNGTESDTVPVGGALEVEKILALVGDGAITADNASAILRYTLGYSETQASAMTSGAKKVEQPKPSVAQARPVT